LGKLCDIERARKAGRFIAFSSGFDQFAGDIASDLQRLRDCTALSYETREFV
jgi:hypothetical protein